jgi:hypothetical protein
MSKPVRTAVREVLPVSAYWGAAYSITNWPLFIFNHFIYQFCILQCVWVGKLFGRALAFLCDQTICLTTKLRAILHVFLY